MPGHSSCGSTPTADFAAYVGEWVHVAATFTDQGTVLYINGVSVGTPGTSIASTRRYSPGYTSASGSTKTGSLILSGSRDGTTNVGRISADFASVQVRRARRIRATRQ